MSDGPEKVLPLRSGAWLEAIDDGYAFHVTIGGSDVVAAKVGLDVLLRFIGPACGFLPADWENGGPSATRTINGPVCIGGPYDGKRMSKTAFPSGRIRVPVRDPHWFKMATAETDEHVSAWTSHLEGEYVLEQFLEANRGRSTVTENEFWWWHSPISLLLP